LKYKSRHGKTTRAEKKKSEKKVKAREKNTLSGTRLASKTDFPLTSLPQAERKKEGVERKRTQVQWVGPGAEGGSELKHLLIGSLLS